jgi:hypothetical protein
VKRVRLETAIRLPVGRGERRPRRVVSGPVPGAEEPAVLVGGGAIEFYTNGAYSTGDLDFVRFR